MKLVWHLISMCLTVCVIIVLIRMSNGAVGTPTLKDFVVWFENSELYVFSATSWNNIVQRFSNVINNTQVLPIINVSIPIRQINNLSDFFGVFADYFNLFGSVMSQLFSYIGGLFGMLWGLFVGFLQGWYDLTLGAAIKVFQFILNFLNWFLFADFNEMTWGTTFVNPYL